LLLADALVVACTGAEPFEGAVVVESGRIADVIEGNAGRVAADLVLACRGRALLPGLIDAHVHVSAFDLDIMGQQRTHYASEVAIRTARILEATLEQGFTTVRDAGGADAGFRRAVSEGRVSGPRLLVSGRPLSQTGGHGDLRRPTESGDPIGCGSEVGMTHVVADGPEQVLRAAREEVRRGADQVKIMASGGAMSPTDRLESVQFTTEEIAAAVAAARSAGTYVLAHAHTPETIRNCVEAGVRSIEHGNLLDSDTAKLMAANDVFLVPTLVAYVALYERGPQLRIPRESLEKVEQVCAHGTESVFFAREAGVRIGSGSDLLGPLARDKWRELALKAEVLGALGALEAATRVNAELLRMDHLVGTIETGKRADIIVVDGNPLDDLALLGRADGPPLVMLDGRPVRNRLG
jgi:imidazolonepropionase-like amidohydrolase